MEINLIMTMSQIIHDGWFMTVSGSCVQQLGTQHHVTFSEVIMGTSLAGLKKYLEKKTKSQRKEYNTQ